MPIRAVVSARSISGTHRIDHQRSLTHDLDRSWNGTHVSPFQERHVDPNCTFGYEVPLGPAQRRHSVRCPLDGAFLISQCATTAYVRTAEARTLMSAVDIGILAIVGLFAVGGMRRGFLLGIVDLVAFGLSLIVAARLRGSVADPLIAWGL